MADASAVHVILSTAPSSTPQFWIGLGWVLEKLVAPVASGAVLAFIGGNIIAKATTAESNRRSYRADVVEELHENINTLREISTKYWLRDYDPTQCPETEAEIQYRLLEIADLVELAAPELWGTQAAAGPKLIADIMAVIVTSTFGTPARRKDPARPNAIAKAMVALTRELMLVRQQAKTNVT